MAYAESKKVQNPKKENDDKLKLYAGGVLVLVVLAVASLFWAPSSKGTIVSKCNSLVFQQDRYGCIESMAISTHNSTMCGNLLGPYQNSCYLSIATNTTNSSLCGKISSTNISNECYMRLANYTDNTGLCSGIQGPMGSQCAYDIAVKTGNVGDCSLVQGENGSNYCNYTVYFDSAIKYQNASYCARISLNNGSIASDGILGNSSVSKYPGLAFNITQILEFAVFYNQSLGARDLCYTSMAFMYQNKSYCSDVQNSDLNSACTSRVGSIGLKNGANITSNSTANMTALINSCAGQPDAATCRYTYMSIEALDTGNISICKSIPSNYSSTCFYYLAVKYNSSTYCSYIKNSTINSACIGDVEGLYPTSTNTSG